MYYNHNRALVVYGADVNHINGEGSSALMAAASRGHADAVHVFMLLHVFNNRHCCCMEPILTLDQQVISI